MSVDVGCMPRIDRLVIVAFLSTLAIAQQGDRSIMLHARGTFTVEFKPLTPSPAPGISRFSINMQIHGGLEGTTKGEMFSGGDAKSGVAGYVAIEVVTGTLEGKSGSFALQHWATMDQNGLGTTVLVVPGSGTGELKGISGTFITLIENRKHTYDLEYSLPK